MESKQCTEAKWTIFENGDIISNKTNKKRKTFVARNGYEMITYTSPEGTKNYYVHALVAKYFIGERPPGFAVNHIDGDKLNNDRTNLEYVTYKDNIGHADRTGLRKNFASGERNGTSKVSDLQADTIVRRVLEGKSNQEIADEFGLHSRYVSLIRHKRRQKGAWARVEGATTIESTDNHF